MKILLNKEAESKFETHLDTGAAFKIRAVSPARYDEIRRKSLRSNGDLDLAKWGANFAAVAIMEWEGVGDDNNEAECNEANRRLFGEKQALNIMPWIIERSMSLDKYRVEEDEAAKKD